MSGGVSAPEIGASERPDGPSEAGPAPTGDGGVVFSFLVGFLVLVAFRHWEIVPGGAFEAVALLTVAGGLRFGFRDGRKLGFLHLFLVLALAFSLVSLLSVTQSTEPEAALKAWMRLLFAQSLGLGCYLLASERRRLRSLTFGGVTGLGVIAAGSLGLVPLGGAVLNRMDDNGRLAGPVGDPNFFGQFLAVGFALAVATALAEKRAVLRGPAVAVAGVTLAAVLGTESRGTLLAFVAIGAVHLLRLSRTARRTVVALVVLGLVLAPGEVVTENTDRLVRVPASVNEALETGAPEDTAVGGRLSEAIAAGEMVRSHPFLGVGIGNYRYRYLDYSVDIGIDPRGEERDSHSRHLEVVAETGFVGAAVWVALLVTCAVLCASALRRRADAGGGGLTMAWPTAFVGWLVTSVFLHDYQPELEWLVIGAVFGTAEVVRAHRADLQLATRPASSSYSATS